jgi:hypothetical protein
VEAEFDGLAEAEFDGLAEAEFDGLAEAVLDGLAEAVLDGLAETELDGLAEAELDGLAEAELDGFLPKEEPPVRIVLFCNNSCKEIKLICGTSLLNNTIVKILELSTVSVILILIKG